jgi:hypothetical protein
MFKEISNPMARRRGISIAAGIGAATAMVVAGSGAAFAASGTQIVTGATAGGVLSITAPPTLALPTLVSGSSTAATNLGSLTWTDTMNDAVVSSVTLAATNLWHAAGAGLYIPFQDFTITADPAPVPNVNNTGAAPTVPAGSPYVLTGAPTTGFAAYSDPITLATSSATSEGSWTETGNQISVAVPGNTTPGTTFAATIQYTVTG